MLNTRLSQIRIPYVMHNRRWTARGCERRPATRATPSSKVLFNRDSPFLADNHDAFRELHLREFRYEEPIGRVRQHVNPLAIEYQVPSQSLTWEEIFEDPQRPLIIDAGSGYGRFPLLAAKNGLASINYLGTEIRRSVYAPPSERKASDAVVPVKLVGRANFWAKQVGVDNRVHFVFTNITISLQSLLEGYPGEVWGVYIQFPDPSFKKRRMKRHIVQPDFVAAIDRVLCPGGLVFAQSDVESCAIHMRNMFDRHGSHFLAPHPIHSDQNDNSSRNNEEGHTPDQQMSWQQLTWLQENPIGFPTEREVYSQEQGRKLYRMLFVKKASD